MKSLYPTKLLFLLKLNDFLFLSSFEEEQTDNPFVLYEINSKRAGIIFDDQYDEWFDKHNSEILEIKLKGKKYRSLSHFAVTTPKFIRTIKRIKTEKDFEQTMDNWFRLLNAR